MISCHYLNKLSKVQAYLHTFKALLKVCRSKHIIKCHTIYINMSLNVTYIRKFKNITCILTFFVIILLHISLLFMYLVGVNPHWHELHKQEKCSSLEPPRGIFYKTQWAWQGVKLTPIMSIFTSKKVWKFLIKIPLTKSNPKRTRG